MKIFSVVLTHEAKINLTAIYDYIYTLNPVAANSWLDGMEDRMKGLEHFSYRGRIIPEAEKNDIYSCLHQILYSTAGNTYRIIYMIQDDVYQIVNIITIRSAIQKSYGD